MVHARNPEISRYRRAGLIPVVYLVEVGGMVKVGCSIKPGWRLAQLHHVHKQRGEFIGRFCTFPISHARGERFAERRAIHALTRCAQVVPGSTEYFTGISYEDALHVVAQFTA